MFSSFSWSNYFLFVGFVLFIYFIVVGILYYSKEIRRLLFFRRDRLREMIGRPVQHTDPMRMVHELVSELGILIANAANGHAIHNELFFSLRQVTKNYLILAPTEFPAKINQYIQEELNRHGMEDFSAQEYEQLWKP
ncbi:MAG: hypothetical protein ABI581_05645 [Sediminibacterium sp.]